MLPNYGLTPTPKQAVWELRLSHWTGDLPALTVNTNWAYRKFDHLFGTFLYDGAPVHGFRSTAGGNPLDSFGRNLYVDTFNSAYGAGWKRENSFLMHKGTGTFCYGFYPHGNRPVGPRRALPRHDHRPRRDARRDVAGRRRPVRTTSSLDRRARRRAARDVLARIASASPSEPPVDCRYRIARIAHGRRGRLRHGRRHRRHRAGVGRGAGGARRRLGRHATRPRRSRR